MTKKNQIAIAVTLLVAAAVLTAVFARSGSKEMVISEYNYKCTECGKVVGLSRTEVARKMQEMRSRQPEITPATLVLSCPDCQKDTCRYALKCGECGQVFVYNRQAPSGQACPECGHDPLKKQQ